MRHPAAECSPSSEMVMRGAVRLVLIGSLSRCQARRKPQPNKCGKSVRRCRVRDQSQSISIFVRMIAEVGLGASADEEPDRLPCIR